MRRLGILSSTRGTHLSALIDAISQKRLPASIEVVVSNKMDAGILERARANNLTAEFVDSRNLSREAFDENISTILHEHNVDYVVLIGYMKILSNQFVSQWRNKIINVHPSLLPAFSGGMDENVHRAVLAASVRESGCTVHYVTEEIDAGPILIQKKCSVYSDDTIESLKSRVQALESEAIIESLIQLG